MGWSGRGAFSVLSLCVACGSSSDGGGGSTTPPSTTPPPDDPGTVQGTPLDGIFVSAHATAGGTGTVESPLNKLADALDLAARSDKPVYACAETFEEAVVLRDGISMYGYFDCSTTVWKRSTAHATIASPTTPAVFAKSLTKETRFEGFDVVSPDLASTVATDKAGTSIALSIRDTNNLSITSCSFRAGNAAPGTSGVDADLNTDTGDPNGKTGRAQTGSCTFGVVTCNTKIPGGAGGTSSCKTTASTGGPGGAGGFGPIGGGPAVDTHGLPTLASTQTAAGGAGRTSSPGTAPVNGTGGAVGTAGDDGTNGSWSFDLDGYHLTAATAGRDGVGGQGGGGGGTQYAYTDNGTSNSSPAGGNGTDTAATGSGGGAGGCGGLAGTQGTGGGASVAAFIVNSGVTMKDTKLETGSGGAAGRGSLGSSELKGGGSFLPPMWAASGGVGGAGGPSGLSGHGAAGPSIVLVYKGVRPSTVGVTLTPGPGGAGHPALTKGTKMLPGVAGDSKEELQF